MPASLSTNSYAVLGMLAIQPWTPYELNLQIRRSLAYCWPVSERAVYNEPERLVAAGLAQVEVEAGGGRPRRSYRITPRGTEALRTWLARTPAPPRFQNEALLRLLFADQASPAHLVEALRRLRAEVVARHLEGAEQIRPYLDGAGPFPHRAHLVALFADLYRRVFTAMEEWADDAVAEVSTWDTTVGRGMTGAAREAIALALRSLPAEASSPGA